MDYDKKAFLVSFAKAVTSFHNKQVVVSVVQAGEKIGFIIWDRFLHLTKPSTVVQPEIETMEQLMYRVLAAASERANRVDVLLDDEFDGSWFQSHDEEE